MSCPSEVADILLAILTMGLMRVRALAWDGRSALCAIEADHIHNLPELLRNYSQELLLYYWDVERPSYVQQVPEDHLAGWEPLWEKLRPFAESLAQPRLLERSISSGTRSVESVIAFGSEPTDASSATIIATEIL